MSVDGVEGLGLPGPERATNGRADDVMEHVRKMSAGDATLEGANLIAPAKSEVDKNGQDNDSNRDEHKDGEAQAQPEAANTAG